MSAYFRKVANHDQPRRIGLEQPTRRKSWLLILRSARFLLSFETIHENLVLSFAAKQATVLNFETDCMTTDFHSSNVLVDLVQQVDEGLQVGFSATILKINSRNSLLTHLLNVFVNPIWDACWAPSSDEKTQR